MIAVALEKIVFHRQRRPLFNGLDLRVEAGRRVVIRGDSGSGKTTLLRLVAGFEAPDAGRVLLAGRVVSEAGAVLVPPHLREVGMVFQDLALWPHMSAYENIAFPLRMKKVSEKRIRRQIEETARRTGIDFDLFKKPDELSGGERQRVALARSLVTAPKVLLMDEPLSSLDEEFADRLAREIVRLQEEMGFTLLFVTHRKSETEIVGQEVVRIDLFKDRKPAG